LKSSIIYGIADLRGIANHERRLVHRHIVAIDLSRSVAHVTGCEALVGEMVRVPVCGPVTVGWKLTKMVQ